MKYLFLLLLTLICLPLMAYSTNDDLFERMDSELAIQLTDDANTGDLNQDVVDDKRATLAELIDSHLRGRYDLPLSPVPALLADIEADLLVDKLYSRRPNIEKPETVKDDFKAAMDLLKSISRGDIKLEEQPDPHEASFRSNKKSSDRVFDDDRLDSF